MNPLPALRQRLAHDGHIARHRHAQAYAAVVLEGSYDEAGELGRRCLRAGDVAIHTGFAAHANRVGRAGASVLNLPVSGLVESFARVVDADAVARAAERDAHAAAAMLRQSLQAVAAPALDWPDQLVLDLAADPTLSLTCWAQRCGITPAALSRGFRRAFGVTPKRWRFECRARRALHALTGSARPLVQIALDAGFADQAQMGHAVNALTGWPPGHWRRWSSADKTRSD
jgi:AraC-like DNA-binding protein